MRTHRSFATIVIALILVFSLSVSCFAAIKPVGPKKDTNTTEEKSADEQMAENSAAWWIADAEEKAAKERGDEEAVKAAQEKKDKLHAENEKLAGDKAGENGSAEYDSENGTWEIEDEDGNKTTTSSSQSGKTHTTTVTETTSNGKVSSSSKDSYSDDVIDKYKDVGGTDETLQDAYNQDGKDVTDSNGYGDINTIISADAETALVKELLGLSDKEAEELEAGLEKNKTEFSAAQRDYYNALASGDEEAAAAAKEKMDKAHQAAQDLRAEYGYTGDSVDAEDGGYYYDGDGDGEPDGKPNDKPNDGGGFTILDYTITSSAGEGGTITPLGVTTVERNSSKTYTITANEGYVVESIVVDGEDIAESLNGAMSYTFNNIKKNHTIHVTFAKTATYNITATATVGGKISPSGVTSVIEGGSLTHRITADEGYYIDRVVVDGRNFGALDVHIFSNVFSDHTIHASFKPIAELEINSSKYTDESNAELDADLDGNSIKSGYGFFADVKASYTNVTDYTMTMTYNFGDGVETVTLEEISPFNFVFPKNSKSPYRNRCVYIPVETLDGPYTLTLTFTGKDPDGNIITDVNTDTIIVKGSMYEDDFVGDS